MSIKSIIIQHYYGIFSGAKLQVLHFCNFYSGEMRISWCNFRRIRSPISDFKPFSADFGAYMG